MTMLEALNTVDALEPNAVAQDQKLAWLRQLEGLIRAHIISPGQQVPDAQAPSAQEGDLEVPLLAPVPWDGIYLHYLQMQIHYTQGEIDRYNQANAMFRSLWRGFRDHHNRTHLPPKRCIQYG